MCSWSNTQDLRPRCALTPVTSVLRDVLGGIPIDEVNDAGKLDISHWNKAIDKARKAQEDGKAEHV